MGGFSDFFNAFFGGRGQPRSRRTTSQATQRRPAYEHPITITLLEAYSGTKRILQFDKERIEVSIPSGVKTGSKVKITGGGPKQPFGTKSDIYLKISVTPDNEFSRSGDDLYKEIDIDLATAVLGGEEKVKTPSGNILLKIPEGTQPGQKFRLSGKGMPLLKRKEKFGDLYIVVNVKIPKKLNDEQKKFFREFER
jgi:curved DNA-binding protein